MSSIDVEALLDSAAQAKPTEDNKSSRDDKRERPHDERNRRDGPVKSPRSERDNRRRNDSRTRNPRRDRHRDNGGHRAGGDFYRSNGGRYRTRSRTPDGDRYRPSRRRDDRDDDRARARGRDSKDLDQPPRAQSHSRRPSDGARERSASPKAITEDERDSRTVFVQQLAARLRTKDLVAFFESVGPVKEAQIVKDRVSGRSKGVGYVEFKDEKSVPLAIELTGQKLMGIPIIAQLTEAEKNRQARNTEGNANSGVPFHRLYVGNIHFSVTEEDINDVFSAFGELEFVQLQKEEQGRSRGYGFVQYRNPDHARMALDQMNGYNLAGRPIRVGLGNDKFTPESTANLIQRFQGPRGQNSAAAFAHGGGRGGQGAPERNRNRDNEKAGGNASALDDTDVGGVNFNNVDRDRLMRKLARTDEPAAGMDRATIQAFLAEPAQPRIAQLDSRCVLLKNMFNPANEEGEDWIKELEDDVKHECEEKYGHVIHIHLDPTTNGDIHVKFDRLEGGVNAIRGLNGRYFGGNMISAAPVVEAIYNTTHGLTNKAG